jgi:hypothetical protein
MVRYFKGGGRGLERRKRGTEGRRGMGDRQTYNKANRTHHRGERGEGWPLVVLLLLVLLLELRRARARDRASPHAETGGKEGLGGDGGGREGGRGPRDVGHAAAAVQEAGILLWLHKEEGGRKGGREGGREGRKKGKRR